MPEVSITSSDGSIGVAQMLKQSGLVASTSEAMRMIAQGGVKIDGEKSLTRGCSWKWEP